MRLRTCLVFLIGIAVVGAVAVASNASIIRADDPSAPAKKLIEFGWDEPDTAFLRGHFGEMEKAPFDGCVFHINTAKSENFTWLCWGERGFAENEFQAAIDDLKALPESRFRHHYLRFNTTPGKVDWFDDFAPILQNARLAAKIAKAGRCAGILFDDEQYEGPLFDYAKQRDAQTKSWDEYAAQARKRGQEVMEAFQSEFPDLKVLLTFGHSLPFRQSESGKRPLAQCSYGLLAPFLDGMIDAAQGRTRIIDGHELSYGYRDADQFISARERMTQGVMPIVGDPEKYRQVVSVGFGIWMDYNHPKHGWNDQDPSKNYFTPEVFEASARAALKQSDEIVWIYSETPRWWSLEGKPVKRPAAYDAALRKARESP